MICCSGRWILLHLRKLKPAATLVNPSYKCIGIQRIVQGLSFWSITISSGVFTLIRRQLSSGGQGRGQNCALSANCTLGKCLSNHLLFHHHSGTKAILKLYSSSALGGEEVFCGAALFYQCSCECLRKLFTCIPRTVIFALQYCMNITETIVARSLC